MQRIPVRSTRAVLALAILTVIAVAVACGGGGGDSDDGAAPIGSYPYPVQRFDEVTPRSHFPVGQTFDGYNSNPPTSGPHAAAPAPFGVSDLAIAKEQAVHNMEHAGVVVWYNCNGGPAPLTSDECTQLRNDLASVVQPAFAGGKSVLMTPYPGMDNRIALTGWQYLDAFDEFDAARVQTFIDTFVCHYDPEHFCG